jgi:membrane associated rhomboid family serine protease
VIPLRDGLPTRRLPVATFSLVLVNVAVFAIQLTLPRWGLTLDDWYLAAGARPRELTGRLDLPPASPIPWWATLVTSLFVHGGWLHLGFNMLYLWIFGNNVEDIMGRGRFVAFYLCCGMVATAAQVIVDPLSIVPIIGASGAVAGVLGAYFVFYPRAPVLTVVPLLVFYPVFTVPAWILLGVWFAAQAAEAALSYGDETAGVAFFAHVGGFLIGAVLAFVIPGRPTGRHRGRRG